MPYVSPFWSAVRPRTALKYFGVRRVSRRFGIFWIAAIYCRFRFTARPLALRLAQFIAALKYFGLRHVSCRFCIFPNAVQLSESDIKHRSGFWQRTLPAHENEEISFNIWDILKNMEDFRACHSFSSRTCVRETKAKLSFRTPHLHPDDELCVRSRRNIRNMDGWNLVRYFVFSDTIE